MRTIVFVCCERKNGEVFQHNGSKIHFVSRPDSCTQIDGNKYVRPDDLIEGEEMTWRDLIILQEDRYDLVAAYELYNHPIYRELYNHFNQNLYIFSAGWGIVRADYKLPQYDITFSRSAPRYSRRKKNDEFNDFNQLNIRNSEDDILFIGGADYILPFCKLTKYLPNNKIIIYKSRLTAEMEEFNRRTDFSFEEYYGINRPFTNWHYTYVRNELLNNL